MKLFKKILLIVLLAGVLAASFWVLVNRQNLVAFQHMPSGAYSKFMCSSLFVVGMTEQEAKDWSALSVPIQSLHIDYEQKTVTSRALFYTSTARFVDERYGCTLE
jgi:hypothetical protein